ncbi:hypothetical protein PINS_up008349 [Pythium insidiosum]|nr:hypothetical protein PINS_up008349 [Pythium insidiosum]
MSCYGVPRSQTNGFLIHKFVGLILRYPKEAAGSTMLHLVSEHCEPLAVQVLLDAGASVQDENSAKETPLVIAARRKDSFGVVVLRCILNAWRDQATEPTKLRTVLGQALIACFGQQPPYNLEIARELLEAGAIVADSQEPQELLVASTSLRFAMQTAEVSAVQLLLEYGAKLSIALSEAYLKNALVVCAASPSRTSWRLLQLKQRQRQVANADGLVALLMTDSRVLNADLIRQLLTYVTAMASTTAKIAGVSDRWWKIAMELVARFPRELASRRHEWGQASALHYAVADAQLEVVKALVIACSDDVDSEDGSKQTPLHLAAARGDVSMCRVLLSGLKKPERIDAADELGRTPLHVSVCHGHELVVALLIDAGASIAARCHHGFSAAIHAAKRNHVDILVALFSRDSSRELLFTQQGEHAMFVAARFSAFQVVRWFISVMDKEDNGDPGNKAVALTLRCSQGRTLLHYAALYGDSLLVKAIVIKLQTSMLVTQEIDRRDDTGYTPLMYAYGFGRLEVLKLLREAGADASVIVDHSNDSSSHPYVSSFSIGALNRWFALPGWLSVALRFPPTEKRRLTARETVVEHFFFSSSFIVSKKSRRGISIAKFAREPASEWELRKRVPVTIRTWRFPKKTLFDYACDVGDQHTMQLLHDLQLPGLQGGNSYATCRRNFLGLVRWNRTDMVQTLLGQQRSEAAVVSNSSTVTYFDFLEVAIDCAIKRGLEDMTMVLLSKWHGIKENGRSGADANAFAFQFAHVFQVACLRGMKSLVTYMIERGQEHIISFHWNDGPALVYAFAFGQAEIARLLLTHGAHVSTIDTYVAPSFKKWIEFDCPREVQVPWYEQVVAHAQDDKKKIETRAAFVGPLEAYAPWEDRLGSDVMAAFSVSPAAREDQNVVQIHE